MLREQVRREIKLRRNITLIILVISLVYSLYAVFVETQKYNHLKENTENAEPIFTEELRELELIGDKISNLKDYISYQKNIIENNRRVLVDYQVELNKLEPISRTDRTAIEALLSLQQQKIESNKWRDRLIGFFIGIIASTIGTIIFEMIINR